MPDLAANSYQGEQWQDLGRLEHHICTHGQDEWSRAWRAWTHFVADEAGWSTAGRPAADGRSGQASRAFASSSIDFCMGHTDIR